MLFGGQSGVIEFVDPAVDGNCGIRSRGEVEAFMIATILKNIATTFLNIQYYINSQSPLTLCTRMILIYQLIHQLSPNIF